MQVVLVVQVVYENLVSAMEKELILIRAIMMESYTEVIFTAQSVRFFYVCYLSVWTKTVSNILPCYVYQQSHHGTLSPAVSRAYLLSVTVTIQSFRWSQC